MLIYIVIKIVRKHIEVENLNGLILIDLKVDLVFVVVDNGISIQLDVVVEKMVF